MPSYLLTLLGVHTAYQALKFPRPWYILYAYAALKSASNIWLNTVQPLEPKCALSLTCIQPKSSEPSKLGALFLSALWLPFSFCSTSSACLCNSIGQVRLIAAVQASNCTAGCTSCLAVSADAILTLWLVLVAQCLWPSSLIA
jgi:hypothetical protein